MMAHANVEWRRPSSSHTSSSPRRWCSAHHPELDKMAHWLLGARTKEDVRTIDAPSHDVAALAKMRQPPGAAPLPRAATTYTSDWPSPSSDVVAAEYAKSWPSGEK